MPQAVLTGARSLNPKIVHQRNKGRDLIFVIKTLFRNILLMKLDRSEIFILGAAFLSFLFSVSLWFGVLGQGNRDTAIFVGLWVPSILALGLYPRRTR